MVEWKQSLSSLELICVKMPFDVIRVMDNSMAIRFYCEIPTIGPSRQGYRGGAEVSIANARYGAVPTA